MLLYMSNSAQEGTSTPLHSVSVAGVVVREDGRLLAIRRADNGTWELPGGVLELDETPETGVRREVLEETGIHVEVDELTGVYKNTTRGIVALVFRCKPAAWKRAHVQRIDRGRLAHAGRGHRVDVRGLRGPTAGCPRRERAPCAKP